MQGHIPPEIIDRLDSIGTLALSRRETLNTSYLLAADIERRSIDGALVECGVYAGAQVAAMAWAKIDSPRPIHLFDSFDGIPQAGPHDDISITSLIGVGGGYGGALVTTGVSACPIEQVRLNMIRWGVPPARLVYHKGWFQDTVPIAAPKIGPIALLRLDGDLYDSTRVCLEHFYDQVVAGGYVIIDDAALTGCRRAVTEFLASRDLRPTIVRIPGGDGPVYWEKQ